MLSTNIAPADYEDRDIVADDVLIRNSAHPRAVATPSLQCLCSVLLDVSALHMLLSLNPMLGLITDFGDSQQQCCQPLPRKLEPFLLFVCTLILLSNHSILVPRINMKGLL